MKVALSIAGSDSGAGAGIQADLKTFSALGVYGCTAITAITAQNTHTVSEIFEVPPGIVAQQIKSLLIDIPPDAAKIGMVFSREIVDTVHALLRRAMFPIVLDPIFAAGTGARLIREDAFESFVSKLIPMSTLITPNSKEAERLAGIKINDEADAISAARMIKKLGAKNVIVKGGHFGRTQVTDVLLDSRGRLARYSNSRIHVKDSHGSGCNFSSAVTAYLARGTSLPEACRLANEYVHKAISNALKIGKGVPVTDPISAIHIDACRYHVLEQLQRAVEQVSALDGFFALIPETQTNLVYALEGATRTSEVAAVRGRIVRIGRAAVPASFIEFGASRHVAAAVLSYMAINPAIRSAINIKFDNKLLKVCRSLFEVSSYDRAKEPLGVKRKEGSTVTWGTHKALSANSRADIIYHTGDIGKEAMINVFGKTPGEVVNRIRSILEKYQ